MTEYAYYGTNAGPGPDGPVWRYQEGFERGVYLRREYSDPAVASRSSIEGYKGYRQLAESEVPEWAKPASDVVEYTPGRLLRGRTWGSNSLVEGEFESQNDDEVCVTLTKVLENLRPLPDSSSVFHPGLSVVLKADTMEAVTPGEVNVEITPDTSAFEDALTALLPEEPTTPRGGVLEEAHDLIHGERNANYGTPTENFERTAALWNAQLGHKLAEGQAFTPQDVALLMVQLKMARLVTSPGKRDHYVDAAGYLACGWECQSA